MFLDTANIKEITDAYQTNIFKGVTTNPTILCKESIPRFNQLKAISAKNVGQIFCQVVGDTKEERFQDYLSIAEFSKQQSIPIVIKVPIDRVGLETIKCIKDKDPNQILLATAIYSSEQGILGVIAGCEYIAPYVNRMEVTGKNPYLEIKRIKKFIDDRKLKTKIMAASFKRPMQVLSALDAGADTCTLSFDVFQAMIQNSVVNDAIAVFNEDGNSLSRNV